MKQLAGITRSGRGKRVGSLLSVLALLMTVPAGGMAEEASAATENSPLARLAEEQILAMAAVEAESIEQSPSAKLAEEKTPSQAEREPLPAEQSALEKPADVPTQEDMLAKPLRTTSPFLSVDRSPVHTDRLPAQLSRSQFIQAVLVRNHVIAGQNLTMEIAGEEVVQAKAAFEPLGKLSMLHGNLRQKSTAEEELVRMNQSLYQKRNNTMDAGVSMLIPTGATVEGKLGLDDIRSNLQTLRNVPEEYKSYVDFSLTQPLAKDGGLEVTSAKTRMAEMERMAAEHTRDAVVSSIVSTAISAYLELRLAQERQAVWNDGMRVAGKLLEEARAMHRQGRLAESALLDVENSYSLYQVGSSEAEQKLMEAMSTTRNLLLATDGSAVVASESIAGLKAPQGEPTVDEMMRTAIQNRAEYLARKAVLDKEGIHVAYADNQTLPRIDMIASYGLNSLEYSGDKSVSSLADGDYPSWKVGVTASFPLGGNQGANAELRMAKKNKEKALLDLMAVEGSIANELQSGLAAHRSSRERLQTYRQILANGEKQLRMERQMLASGRSDMRSVLSREEALVRTKVSFLEQMVALEKARVALQLAQGVLLTDYPQADKNQRPSLRAGEER
jgi:outer membrane protein TolC